MLQVGVQPLTLGEHLIEPVLAQDRAQGGLRQLGGQRLKSSTWMIAFLGSMTR